MTANPTKTRSDSDVIKQMCLYFSLFMIIVSIAACIYTGQTAYQMFTDWARILTSPAQLLCDYFSVGGLAGTFFNAGLLGLIFTLIMYSLKANVTTGVLASFILTLSHSFFGMNLVNVWPMFLGCAIVYGIRKDKLRNHLDVAMFSMNFAPFVSELLFRHELFGSAQVPVAEAHLQIWGIPAAIIFGIVIGFIFPAILPSVKKLHNGLSLYNAGLASGFIGMMMFAFFYKTLGFGAPSTFTYENEIYIAHGNNYNLFCNVVLIILFASAVIIGCAKNKGFKGYGKLLKDSGHNANFIRDYGEGCTWMNFGFYGFLLLVYFDLVIFLMPKGVGFTGITAGFLLAALTFFASGQHPGTAWTIMAGYVILWAVIALCALGTGRDIPWFLSTQGYLCTVALGTGLSPFAGVYGKKAGIFAGIVCAIFGCIVSTFHGGLILYNSGFGSGLASIIVFAVLDHYKAKKRTE
ncbi:MAG: DUF1576 domain-containing protein [Eubacterium sp.]|nr:DUF1576 domain-containing protein [Eubacterium sp.]